MQNVKDIDLEIYRLKGHIYINHSFQSPLHSAVILFTNAIVFYVFVYICRPIVVELYLLFLSFLGVGL